jgi:glycosyltransferase involved in cell wall biosynthesis
MRRTIIYIAGKDPRQEIGGHSSYVRAHARAAIQAGFEPHLFCAAPRGGVTQTDFGVIHRAASPFRPFRALMVPAHAPLVADHIERFLSGRKGPHLIHSFGPWGHVGLMVAKRLVRRGIEVVPIVSAYTTYDHEIHGKLQGLNGAHGLIHHVWHWAQRAWITVATRPCERRAYAGSRLVLVNYESVRRLLWNTYGADVEVLRLPYTSESAFHREEENPPAPAAVASLTPSGAPLVVAVSRHDPRKGVDVLLRALAELQAAGVPYRACLVGGGPLLPDHRRLAARLGLNKQVSLPGKVPDPAPYLRHASVFVLPSLEEGSGSVSLIESLQAGVAVVASNIDGIPEDVVDGDSALLVPPADSSALCRAIGLLIRDPVLRQRLASRGRQQFLDRFSAAAFTDALCATYAALGFAA